tara:strand:+ start:348 stop:476 length:129 start_codon:yes stop_codon:yes gene_type:complete
MSQQFDKLVFGKKNDANSHNTPGKDMKQNNQENAEKRISVTG